MKTRKPIILEMIYSNDYKKEVSLLVDITVLREN
jgi:hypothetical protein